MRSYLSQTMAARHDTVDLDTVAVVRGGSRCSSRLVSCRLVKWFVNKTRYKYRDMHNHGIMDKGPQRKDTPVALRDNLDHPVTFVFFAALAISGALAFMTWGAKSSNLPGLAAFVQHP